jgi:hypothetical protein
VTHVVGEGAGERVDAIPGITLLAIEGASNIEELETTSEPKFEEEITTFPSADRGHRQYRRE